MRYQSKSGYRLLFKAYVKLGGTADSTSFRPYFIGQSEVFIILKVIFRK